MNFNLNDLKNYAKKIAKESNPEPLEKDLTVGVAGVSFDSRQALIKVMTKYTPVALFREPDNAYDKNAVAVKAKLTEDMPWLPIGYIPKEYSAQVSSLLLSGEKFSVAVEKFNGFENDGELDVKGLNIAIKVGE